MAELTRSVAEDLADTTYLTSEAERLRDMAFRQESDAHRYRAKADALELEAVERRTAANILREHGLTVGRDGNGVPWVKVERTVELTDNHPERPLADDPRQRLEHGLLGRPLRRGRSSLQEQPETDAGKVHLTDPSAGPCPACGHSASGITVGDEARPHTCCDHPDCMVPWVKVERTVAPLHEKEPHP